MASLIDYRKEAFDAPNALVFGGLGAGTGALLGGGRQLLSNLFTSDGSRVETDPYGRKVVIPGKKRPSILGAAARGGLKGGLLGGAFGGLTDLATAGGFGGDGITPTTVARPAPGGLPNKTVETSLYNEIAPYYKDAPGGIDAAIAAAQKHIPEGERFGLQKWDPERLKETSKVVMVDTPDLAQSNGLGGITFVGNRSSDPLNKEVFVAAPKHEQTPRVQHIKEHELTHRSMQPNDHDKLFSQAVNGKTVVPYPGLLNSGISAGRWEYMNNPDEFKAWSAPVKREWVQATGRQLTTPTDAEEAIDWYLKNKAPQHKFDDASKQFINGLNKDPYGRRALIQQLLQLVQGNTNMDIAKTATWNAADAGKVTGLTPFAEGFLVRCTQRGLTDAQIKTAAEKAAETHPEVAAELAPVIKRAAQLASMVQPPRLPAAPAAATGPVAAPSIAPPGPPQLAQEYPRPLLDNVPSMTGGQLSQQVLHPAPSLHDQFAQDQATQGFNNQQRIQRVQASRPQPKPMPSAKPLMNASLPKPGTSTLNQSPAPTAITKGGRFGCGSLDIDKKVINGPTQKVPMAPSYTKTVPPSQVDFKQASLAGAAGKLVGGLFRSAPAKAVGGALARTVWNPVAKAAPQVAKALPQPATPIAAPVAQAVAQPGLLGRAAGSLGKAVGGVANSGVGRYYGTTLAGEGIGAGVDGVAGLAGYDTGGQGQRIGRTVGQTIGGLGAAGAVVPGLKIPSVEKIMGGLQGRAGTAVAMAPALAAAPGTLHRMGKAYSGHRAQAEADAIAQRMHIQGATPEERVNKMVEMGRMFQDRDVGGLVSHFVGGEGGQGLWENVKGWWGGLSPEQKWMIGGGAGLGALGLGGMLTGHTGMGAAAGLGGAALAGGGAFLPQIMEQYRNAVSSTQPGGDPAAVPNSSEPAYSPQPQPGPYAGGYQMPQMPPQRNELQLQSTAP